MAEALQTTTNKQLVLKVDGMTCSHCEASVGGALKKLPGVIEAEANAAANRVTLTYQGKATPKDYRATIREIGFTPVEEHDASTTTQRAERRAKLELRLLLWSLCWTIPVLVLHYGGFMHEPWALWAAFGCATILQPTSAITYYKAATASIRMRVANMDVLVSIGVAAGYSYASLTTIFPETFDPHSSMEFFEAATLLICFIRLGKWIEARSRMQAASAMDSLLSLTPARAHRLTSDGSVEEVDSSEIRIDDGLVIRSGDTFPVDGVILEGESSANESLISGESMPVPKRSGDKVIAGSINEGGKLIVRATSIGSDTTVARIAQMVETAQADRAPAQRLADKISNVFVPLVVLIAISSGIYWGAFTEVPFSRVLTHVIGVLVIACPCALGIAVPAAIMIGSGAGLRKGILVKSGGALERLSKLDRIVFDKTGTLTLGKPKLIAFYPASDVDKSDALSALARVAQESSHPLSKAARQGAAARGVDTASVDGTSQEISGMGTILYGALHSYVFGSAALMQREGVDISPLQQQVDKARSQGASISYIARQGRLLGACAFKDPLRPEARELISAIHKRGIATSLVSGDHQAAAESIAQEIGIQNVIAGAKPADKIQAIKDWQSKGEEVAMIGDGINDAPALAQANVGVAVGGGSDVAKESGHIVLMSGGIENLKRALELSYGVRRGIRGNLFVSLIYNAIGIPLAAGLGTLISPGLVIPAGFAAMAMVMSDGSVALNSALLRVRLQKI